jgi:Ca-activated chloride channel family protein
VSLPEPFEGFEFAHPWALLLLLLVPVAAWWIGKRGQLPSITVPSLSALRGLCTVPRRRSGASRFALPLIVLTLLCFAIARPRLPRGDLPDPTKGIDIMLTLDFSRSMAEQDFHYERKRISRREALIKVVEGFIQGRPNDRVGIVCFARSPFLVAPLTLDHDWALTSLKETDHSTGTAIGEGLAASEQFLKRHSTRSKVIILVTDGQNMIGRPPLQIAPMLLRDGIRLYSILIGPEIVTPTVAARHELNRASRITGGQFFQARDTLALQKVYSLIDQLEKKALTEKQFITWRELFPSLVGISLALLIFDFTFNEMARRRIP